MTFFLFNAAQHPLKSGINPRRSNRHIRISPGRGRGSGESPGLTVQASDLALPTIGCRRASGASGQRSNIRCRQHLSAKCRTRYPPRAARRSSSTRRRPHRPSVGGEQPGPRRFLPKTIRWTRSSRVVKTLSGRAGFSRLSIPRRPKILSAETCLAGRGWESEAVSTRFQSSAPHSEEVCFRRL